MTRISIDGYEPAHLSHSTIGSYRMCGKKFELTKILRREERPGLAAIGGNALHVVSEWYDRGELEEGADIAEAYRSAWDAEVEKRQQYSPSFKPEEYTATGRATAAYGGKRTTQWWMDNGPQMVQDWIDWRQETGWIIPDIGGQPAVEIEMNFTIPGLDMMVKAFIDRVFVMPTGEMSIVDLKSGRTPETAEQLGLYRVGLGLLHGLWPDWGHFWSPGGKGHGQPIDLTAYTPERFAVMFNQAIAGINAGAFLPQPANSCRNWCGVADYCAAVGGSKAAGVDSLAV